MKTIKLSQGYVALVDDEDYERVSAHKWRPLVDTRRTKTVYVRTTVYADGKEKAIYLHRFVRGETNSKIQIDHKDGNGLNCQKENLRVATNGQNQMNMRKKTKQSSVYKGVTWDTQTQLWRAVISPAGKTIHLGRFSNEREAAQAYDVAALQYYGEFACSFRLIKKPSVPCVIAKSLIADCTSVPRKLGNALLRHNGHAGQRSGPKPSKYRVSTKKIAPADLLGSTGAFLCGFLPVLGGVKPWS